MFSASCAYNSCMPPSPIYNWFAVLVSVSDVFRNALLIHQRSLIRQHLDRSRIRKNYVGGTTKIDSPVANVSRDASGLGCSAAVSSLASAPETTADSSENIVRMESRPTEDHIRINNEHNGPLKDQPSNQPVESPEFSASVQDDIPVNLLDEPRRTLQPSAVPSSRIGRLFHYGGLATSLSYGAAIEMMRRTRSESDSGTGQSSLVLNPANVSRLVSKLSKMRGAALKLGQFLSIQDTHLLPKNVEEIFRRVQNSAHYMPNWQLERVMSDSLGKTWREYFTTFEAIPFAAASLGQVHSAKLKSSVSPTGQEEHVAVKVQFPKVRESIESDVSYLKTLLAFGKILPPGLFLEKSLKVLKEELEDECNYIREAGYATRFRTDLRQDARFYVPWVWKGSTREVLVMEYLEGVSVGGAAIDSLRQTDRDEIACAILELCLIELFDVRVMQTDPNWTNFLWNQHTHQIGLIDFGASREYSKAFIDRWMRLLQAAVVEDRNSCIEWSLQLEYLTGSENEAMLDAHVRSLVLLATPFRIHGLYKFGKGSNWNGITDEIRSLIPVMLRNRLTPPPRETYSLNRKLSGAFLLASRLNASVDCNKIWEKIVGRYTFEV